MIVNFNTLKTNGCYLNVTTGSMRNASHYRLLPRLTRKAGGNVPPTISVRHLWFYWRGTARFIRIAYTG